MIFIGFDYLNDEIKWKKIYWLNGEETKYSISNIGIVRNDKNGKLLKTNFSKGYERLNLTHNGVHKQFFVHRLVAIAFIPNPDNKDEVNHINGIKSCNYDYNLEWIDRSENVIHAYKTGLMPDEFSEDIKLTKKQIKKICKLLEENELNQSEIARKVGCSRYSVYNILKKGFYSDISCNYNIDNYDVKTNFSKKGDKSERTKYPDKDIVKVCELIDSGNYELPEVAKISGVPYQTVRNVYYGTCRKDITKNYNFGKHKNPIYEKKKEQAIKVCELLNSGLNTREVSEKLGVPRTYVRNICAGTTWYDVSQDYDFMKAKKNKKK